MDSLCLKILELNGLTLVEHEHSDGEADMDEQVCSFFTNTSGRNFLKLFQYLKNYWLDCELPGDTTAVFTRASSFGFVVTLQLCYGCLSPFLFTCVLRGAS